MFRGTVTVAGSALLLVVTGCPKKSAEPPTHGSGSHCNSNQDCADDEWCADAPVVTELPPHLKYGVEDHLRPLGTGHCQSKIACTVEVCDGRDNDCDGEVDEFVPWTGDFCNRDGCTFSRWSCDEGEVVCSLPPQGRDDCDGVDSDCDGVVDEDGFLPYSGPASSYPYMAYCRTNFAPKQCLKCAAGTGCDADRGCVETACDDGVDNDGDGARDCEDTDCLSQACDVQPGEPEKNCGGTPLTDGGILRGCVPQETNCGNGADDDLDGLADCDEGDRCLSAICAPGRKCWNTGFSPPDKLYGCLPYEICGDGIDNDNNGATDCEESICTNTPCGDGGLCGPFAKCRQVEHDCANGLDDDGDLQVDCNDDDCLKQPCATGRKCASGACSLTEQDCGNGLDDDSDGQSDCGDDDCLGKSCANDAGVCYASGSCG